MRHRSRRRRQPGGTAVALLLLLFAAAATGQEPPPPVEESATTPAETVAEVADPPVATTPAGESNSEGAAGAPAAESDDPCAVLIPPDAPWIDRARLMMARALCTSVEGVDRFFGGREFDERREGTWGRLSVLADWDERDGWSGKGRLRARIELPRTKQRLYALVGRGDETELLQDRGEAFTALPESFRNLADDEWLIGLGFSPPRRTHGKFGVDVGVRARFPLEPYVKGNWSTARFFGEESLARYRHTVFWRGDDGFGSTGRLDLERLLGPRALLRWTNSGTWSEATDGLFWFSTLTLYQDLSKRRAVAWHLRAEGETGEEVPLRYYGVGATLRLNILRRWLYLEMRPALNWRREKLDERRELVPALAVGFDIALDRALE